MASTEGLSAVAEMISVEIYFSYAVADSRVGPFVG